MRVPFVDLRKDQIRDEIATAMLRVLDSGQYVLGPEVETFEEKLATYTGNRHAVGVSSGTDALLATLMALGVGLDDEVVTTPFTFFATAGVIARLGARPVFADIDEETFNLDPKKALAVCTQATAVYLPVCLYGGHVVLPEVGDLHGIPVVKDAAQALGGLHTNRVRDVEAATFSFFPTKNLGALGDGGAVVTDDAWLAKALRALRNQGAQPKYYHRYIGGNFRLDALQAAILSAKIEVLDYQVNRRRFNAERYRKLFAAANVPDELRLPCRCGEGLHCYNQFVIRAPRRDELRSFLADAEIATEIYYPLALHLQPCFRYLGYKEGAFSIAERATKEVLALPIFPSLTEHQQAHVVNRIAAFYRG